MTSSVTTCQPFTACISLYIYNSLSLVCLYTSRTFNRRGKLGSTSCLNQIYNFYMAREIIFFVFCQGAVSDKITGFWDIYLYVWSIFIAPWLKLSIFLSIEEIFFFIFCCHVVNFKSKLIDFHISSASLFSSSKDTDN